MLISYYKLKKSKFAGFIRSFMTSPLGVVLVSVLLALLAFLILSLIILVNYKLISMGILPQLPCSNTPENCLIGDSIIWIVLEMLTMVFLYGLCLLTVETYYHVARDMKRYDQDIIKHQQ